MFTYFSDKMHPKKVLGKKLVESRKQRGKERSGDEGVLLEMRKGRRKGIEYPRGQ
jgi:hypothetical protein